MCKNSSAYRRSRRAQDVEGCLCGAAVSRRLKEKVRGSRDPIFRRILVEGLESGEQIPGVITDQNGDIAEIRLEIFQCMNKTRGDDLGLALQSSAAQSSSQVCANVKIFLDVSSDTFVDQIAELRVIKRGTVLFNQAVHFIEDKIFRMDVVIGSGQQRYSLFDTLGDAGGLSGLRHGFVRLAENGFPPAADQFR